MFTDSLHHPLHPLLQEK